MGKNLKSTLAATLAATLATGMVVPAMASDKEVNVDELYAAAYNATIKAQETGTQEDINTARKAIEALEGTDAAWAIGEFSKLVDAPQQIILTEIVDGIEANEKEPNQESINHIRTLILGLKDVDSPERNWVNSYSVALDAAQQILIDEAVAAVEKAKESGAQADIDAAQKLIDSLKTATNNDGVVEWIKAFEEAELAPLKGLRVSQVSFENEKKILVELNKEVNAETVEVRDFYVVESGTENKHYVKSVKVLEDNKNVEVVLENSVKENKSYDITVSGIADKSGVELEETTSTIKYEKAIVKSISFKTVKAKFDDTKTVLDYLSIKDEKGRDITEEFSIDDFKIESTNNAIVGTDGSINDAGKANVRVTLLDEDGKPTNIKTDLVELTFENSEATTFDGYTLTESQIPTGTKLSSVEEKDKKTFIKEGETLELGAFYKDQFGNELELDMTGVTIESKGSAVSVVSNTQLIGEKEGTATITIKKGDIVKNISVTVKKEAVESKLSLSQNKVKVSTGEATTGNNVTRIIKAKLTNQYGEEMEPLQGAFTLGSEDKNNKPSELGINSDTGEITITVAHDSKAKVIKDTLIYKNGNVELKVNFEVEIVNPGEATTGYKVELLNDGKTVDTELDLSNKDDNKLLVKVTKVDGKGNIVKVESPTFVIKDEDGKEVNGIETSGIITPTKVGTYTVDIEIGSAVIKTITINVKDTASTPTTVVIDNSEAITTIADYQNITAATNVLENAIQDKIKVFDQYGKEMKDHGYKFKITNVSFDQALRGREDYDAVIKEVKVLDTNNSNQEVATIKVPNTVVRISFGC